jgi:hypothetical protein
MGHEPAMSESDERLAALETRLARLEAAQAPASAGAAVLSLHPAWPLGLGIVALGLGYLGLGLPQHYYQPLFAALFLLLAYHRSFFQRYANPWRWPLIGLNFLLLMLVFKLLLGGGLSYPFDWLKVPTMQQLPPADDSWTQKYIPHYQLVWSGVPGISDWYVNITKIQSMLLIATLIGALFRFQPFASLTALALLIISFPSYLAFNWDFVVLFLVVGGTALYLQNATRQ